MAKTFLFIFIVPNSPGIPAIVDNFAPVTIYEKIANIRGEISIATKMKIIWQIEIKLSTAKLSFLKKSKPSKIKYNRDPGHMSVTL